MMAMWSDRAGVAGYIGYGHAASRLRGRSTRSSPSQLLSGLNGSCGIDGRGTDTQRLGKGDAFPRDWNPGSSRQPSLGCFGIRHCLRRILPNLAKAQKLILGLWDYEAWRVVGHFKDDGDYDLLSQQLGYDLVGALAHMVKFNFYRDAPANGRNRARRVVLVARAGRRCRFSKPTLAGTAGNGSEAPKPVILATQGRPRDSTGSGHSPASFDALVRASKHRARDGEAEHL
jgi:hypothetical protein